MQVQKAFKCLKTLFCHLNMYYLKYKCTAFEVLL